MTEQTLEPLPHTGIVPIEELRRYMGFPTWNERQRLNAGEVLAGVQQELENHLNRPLEPVQVRQVITSDLQGFLNLTVTPVHKILSCVIFNSTFELTAIYTSPEDVPVQERSPLVGPHGRLLDIYRPGNADPFIVPGGCLVGTVGTPYMVEYIGGYNGYVNLGLKNAIKRVAAREVAPNHDKTMSLRGGNVEAANEPDNRERGWTLEELMKWDRIRRRVIA